MSGTKRKIGQPTKMEPVYTVEQAAGYLSLSTRTVREYIRSGRIPARRIGREFRIKESALAALVEVGNAE